MAKGYKLEWDDRKIMASISSIAQGISREGAALIAKDTRQAIPWDTGTLATSVRVEKSRYKDGGYMATVQGPSIGSYGKWYASFVELGTFKDTAQPFLRPSMHKNTRKIQKMYRDALTK
jgi:HK97 gp10 family phage protein